MVYGISGQYWPHSGRSTRSAKKKKTLQYCVSAQEAFSLLFGLGLGFPSVRYIHKFSDSF